MDIRCVPGSFLNIGIGYPKLVNPVLEDIVRTIQRIVYFLLKEVNWTRSRRNHSAHPRYLT
ncbi:MAG: hypothetical protein HC880_19015 [Bacteroidia bacterium]|nr:hypothetical protein [Bacteroidia bacterium]